MGANRDPDPSESLHVTQPGSLPSTQEVDELGATDLGLSKSAPVHDSGAALPATLDVSAFPVQNWERYEFIKPLGQGAMGMVYQARDKKLDRIVALKFIRGNDQRLMARLQQEARIQARIEHPQICKVYEVGQVQAKPYIAMQYVSGQSLELVRKQMSLAEKVMVVRDVALALQEAHRLGVVHRDIKPGNILVEKSPAGHFQPVVMDFGLARAFDTNEGLTESGAVMGTPAFMSPEQASGQTKNVDRRSDVYSLGATLYDLLAERPPFVGTSVAEVLLSVLTHEPEPVRTLNTSVPQDLDTITMKCLNKEPGHRYDSARALAEDLDRYLNGESILGRKTSVWYRLRLRIRRNKLAVAVSLISLLGLLVLGSYVAQAQLALRRVKAQAQKQQALGQRLALEMRDLEWLLRTARGMPLHSLEREKQIVRRRMSALQTELTDLGPAVRPLVHYALGRGHMALQEYPAAQRHLEQAIAQGYDAAEVHHSLGMALGKNFEQAMYEAQLSGGREWAQKQRPTLEPKYLIPAIDSLSRSRVMKLDAPLYLEVLISYYRRDFDAALRQAVQVLDQAPWMYEATKLAADIYLERALLARDGGRDREAEQTFDQAVKSYETAARVGNSDAEVYEGLAETWVRRTEMARNRGQPTEEFYAAAVSASDKILAVDPLSITALLRKAHAGMMTAAILGSGVVSVEGYQRCQKAAEAALKQQPGNPYVQDAAANCKILENEIRRLKGQDHLPPLLEARKLLESAVKEHPHFLWGINDLGLVNGAIGNEQQRRGEPDSKELKRKELASYMAAASLDPTYQIAAMNVLVAIPGLILETRSEKEIGDLLKLADEWLVKCRSIDSRQQQCPNNYFQGYAFAAERLSLAGLDPKPQLAVALRFIDETRKLGGSLQDLEQISTKTHLFEARDLLQQRKDPTPSLLTMKQDLQRCFVHLSTDPLCRTLAAQAEWVAADWQVQQNKSAIATLESALVKAKLATESPQVYPDAWQTVAETHLRLARSKGASRQPYQQHIALGLAAADRVFAVNPNHAVGRATQGELLILAARAAQSSTERITKAQSAIAAFEKAIHSSPLLTSVCSTPLSQARVLAQSDQLPVGTGSSAAP